MLDVLFQPVISSTNGLKIIKCDFSELYAFISENIRNFAA
ncbi:hypothetical protein HMPREF0658_0161 [Hoylesella marshii DSM 16973 = JCM 13450]|uniref:Uncharacterized protein n=1 Tax=Hoylesella marshii DSM 16973 = JCM 13450 TaxID=862515 RepID=E0NPR0_9BACT|nr:hypothetical protein HMPREF0658_0161 [Hoylesella marshii DSM 16973 = JCM 13450]